MIAHAAEAGEDRGRVIVRLGTPAASSNAALSAAAHVARAFRSEIEAIFIEDAEACAAMSHDRVRVLSPAGVPRAPHHHTHETGFTQFAAAAQREVAGRAASSGVAFKSQRVHGGVIAALQAACAERGPWNIVAFAEPISTPDRAEILNAALTKVWGTTAFIAAGTSAVWRPGPILAVVEDIERLSGFVRAAERLAAVAKDRVLLLPAGADAIAQDWLESEIGLTLGLNSGATVLARPGLWGGGGLRSEIERLKPRIVLARHGGEAIPAERTHLALSQLSAPAFILH